MASRRRLWSSLCTRICPFVSLSLSFAPVFFFCSRLGSSFRVLFPLFLDSLPPAPLPLRANSTDQMLSISLSPSSPSLVALTSVRWYLSLARPCRPVRGAETQSPSPLGSLSLPLPPLSLSLSLYVWICGLSLFELLTAHLGETSDDGKGRVSSKEAPRLDSSPRADAEHVIPVSS